MKHQAIFFSEDKSEKKLKCRLLQYLFGNIRVKLSSLRREEDADQMQTCGP